MALAGAPIPVHTVIAGLGGRAITKESLRQLFRKACKDALSARSPSSISIMTWCIGEIERLETHRRSGPTAENILRDLGIVADHIG